MVRWWKFNIVGALGILVQMATLAFLTRVLGVHYLWATSIAVEVAVLHNFFWHLRWTWADRSASAAFGAATFNIKTFSTVTSGTAGAFMRFQAGNGAVSLFGNFVCMWFLVGTLALQPMPANLLSIAICYLANYLLAHRFAFSPKRWGPQECPLQHTCADGTAGPFRRL